MRYWWVNQNRTHRHEIEGGYLWSPKRNANGARNAFYEIMSEVAPGDLVLLLRRHKNCGLGVAQSYCWESPKPAEFGQAGQNWETVGWKVKVEFCPLPKQIRPKDHIDVLRPFLTGQRTRRSNRRKRPAISLSDGTPTLLAEVLQGLIGDEVAPSCSCCANGHACSRQTILRFGSTKSNNRWPAIRRLAETERLAIIRARKGQGLFKERVSQDRKQCRVTRVEDPTFI